ncbi:MAG: ATP-binding protein [Rhodocyclaceae bacterium]|nr:ATP-binding protein [Rhodocyclaceae bacterium]
MASRDKLSLRRLWPASLLARSFLLIAALMLLSVAAWITIFERVELDRRARQIAQIVASVSNLTRAALLAAHPERRRALLAELSDREGIRLYPADAHDLLEAPPANAFFTRLGRELETRLGEKTMIAWSVNGEAGFFVRLRLLPDDEESYWLALPRARLERPGPLGWLAWGALVLAAALLGAWWIVWRLNRPLAALAHAARKVGAGQPTAPLAEEGPSELVAVIKAFNQMNTDLERAAEDRALLLAGVSHDLRTPLARLRMDIEMYVTEEAARAAMSADIDDMDRTIGQFLDFARPLERSEQLIDPAELLSEFAQRFPERIALSLPQEPLRCRAAAMTLRRAVANLIDNALRYGQSSRIEVALRKAGEEIVIEIADRGPGIDEASLQRVKRPFVRGDVARSDTTGTGLGLAIVERAMQTMGGRLALANRVGGGLSACLILPSA